MASDMQVLKGKPARRIRRLAGAPVWLVISVALVLAGACVPARAQAPTLATPVSDDYVRGQLLVRFRRDVPAAMLTSTRLLTGLQTVQTMFSTGLELVRVEPGKEADTLARLRDDPLVEYAGYNYIAHIAGEPTDPAWWRQWDMRQIGAPTAWDMQTGNDLIVAIVDSGVDASHPDLASKLVAGYDYVNGDALPNDDHGHGTHVAGIVAAIANNGIGIAGLSWGARIMPIKVLDAHGDGSYYQIIQGIRYAADHGAKIINLSLGGVQADPNLRSAIQYATAKDCLVIAAVGNQSSAVLYPAAYVEATAVAATNERQEAPDYSNYGPEVDLAAPGGSESAGIYSLAPGGGYANQYGTSMSAPHVAGVAALVWSAAPSWSAADVMRLLQETAARVGQIPYDAAGHNDRLGYGQVNAAAALQRVAGGTPPPATPTTQPAMTPTPTSPLVPHTLEIPLSAGWNLVSFNVQPSLTQIETLTAQLRPDLEMVLGYQCAVGGLSYYPDLPASISTLHTMEAGRGYWLKMRQAGVWRVTGAPLPAHGSLALCAGWNLAGYLPSQELSASAAFASLSGALSVAMSYRDGLGRSYYPDLAAPLNSLQTVHPGSGYWLLANRPATLTYPQ